MSGTRRVVHQARGHYFSLYPDWRSVAGVAALLADGLLSALRHWDPGSLVMLARIAEKFAAAAIAALSAVFLLLLLKRITTAPWAWCLTLVYALATETWSISSQALWQHGPGELAIIGCFYCLQRWSEDRDAQWMAVAVRRMRGRCVHHSAHQPRSVAGSSRGAFVRQGHAHATSSLLDCAAARRLLAGEL